jgi:heme-degrading monooxygenase HmoA
MVTEIAYITIDPVQTADFEAAVAEAAPLFQSAKGCRSMRLESTIEDAAQYRLIVDWDTVEAHMVDFRNSADFARWRELAGPFFVVPPKVEHWTSQSSFF